MHQLWLLVHLPCVLSNLSPRDIYQGTDWGRAWANGMHSSKMDFSSRSLFCRFLCWTCYRVSKSWILRSLAKNLFLVFFKTLHVLWFWIFQDSSSVSSSCMFTSLSFSGCSSQAGSPFAVLLPEGCTECLNHFIELGQHTFWELGRRSRKLSLTLAWFSSYFICLIIYLIWKVGWQYLPLWQWPYIKYMLNI